MTEELQTAYNEWLIKYGYREVSIDQACIDNVYYLINALHNYMLNYPLKRTQTNIRVIYQLKTHKELQ